VPRKYDRPRSSSTRFNTELSTARGCREAPVRGDELGNERGQRRRAERPSWPPDHESSSRSSTGAGAPRNVRTQAQSCRLRIRSSRAGRVCQRMKEHRGASGVGEKERPTSERRSMNRRRDRVAERAPASIRHAGRTALVDPVGQLTSERIRRLHPSARADELIRRACSGGGQKRPCYLGSRGIEPARQLDPAPIPRGSTRLRSARSSCPKASTRSCRVRARRISRRSRTRTADQPASADQCAGTLWPVKVLIIVRS